MKKNIRPARCPNCKGMLVYTIANSKCLKCGWIYKDESTVKRWNGSIIMALNE